LASLIILFFSCEEVSTREELRNKTKTEIEKISEVYLTVMYDSMKLAKFGLDSLRFKRNEIFARRGLIFKSKDLQEFFSKFDWYLPKYNNVDSLLNETDKKNINLVISIENFKSKKLNYIRSLPKMHSQKDMYNYFEVDFKDYPYWNEPIPNQNDPHNAIFVIGKKEFSNCIFLTYFSFGIGVEGAVPPSHLYYYCIDLYDFNCKKIDSIYFWEESLADFKEADNKIYFYTDIYQSIYSKEEEDSSYYDEMHIEKVGVKEKVFYLDLKKKKVIEITDENKYKY